MTLLFLLGLGLQNSRNLLIIMEWCAMQGLNLRLLACEASALPLS